MVYRNFLQNRALTCKSLILGKVKLKRNKERNKIFLTWTRLFTTTNVLKSLKWNGYKMSSFLFYIYFRQYLPFRSFLSPKLPKTLLLWRTHTHTHTHTQPPPEFFTTITVTRTLLSECRLKHLFRLLGQSLYSKFNFSLLINVNLKSFKMKLEIYICYP